VKMPKFVQQFTGKTFAFIEPPLDWARGKISSIGESAGSLKGVYFEPNLDWAREKISPVSSKISEVQGLVEPKLDWAREKIAPLSLKISEVQGLVVLRSLGLVESSESFIDRLLPLPKPSEAEDVDEQQSVLPLRIARLPFRAPVRVSMMVYVKANGTIDMVVLSGRHVASVARDKQMLFVQNIMQRARPLTDKVQSGCESASSRILAGKDSASKVISVQINGVIVRLRLVEVKDWSAVKADALKKNTVSLVTAVMQGAHGTSARVIGQNRATFIFTKLKQATFVLTSVQLPLELEQKVEICEIKSESHAEIEGSVLG